MERAGREPQPVGGDEIGRARRMHVEHEDHRRRMGGFVGQVEADVDFHALYSLFGTDILTSRSAIVGSVTVQGQS